jgi:hypothetical protein
MKQSHDGLQEIAAPTARDDNSDVILNWFQDLFFYIKEILK